MNWRKQLATWIDGDGAAAASKLRAEREQLLLRNAQLQAEQRGRSDREQRLDVVLRYIAQRYPLHEAGQLARAALIEDGQ